MQNLSAFPSPLIGPLIGTNFSSSTQKVDKSVRSIANDYDVSAITERQKTLLSKELFDCDAINAIEHAILSLPHRQIEAALSKSGDANASFNLLDFYRQKVAVNSRFTNLSPAKTIDEKFLFIMTDLDKYHRQ
ncbi:MAG: hypothetical protein OFPII_35410 [Osedax symbiont Rs1]|nr:MAG: hypothetical protein OFPII_35410 [Osedax symbiont Rs1]